MKVRLFALLSLIVFVVLPISGGVRPSVAQSHQVGTSHRLYSTSLGESSGDYSSDASIAESREGGRLRSTSTMTTIISYGDTGYRYKVVSHGEEEGFEQPGFDDFEFSTGDAGFGIPSGVCPLNNPTDVRTTWPLNTDILLRKQFTLLSGSNTLKVGVAIDNDVQVFINGHDISGGLRVHENCPTRDSFVFAVPGEVLTVGTNLLAVRGRDRGGLSYLDIQLTVEIVKLYLPMVIRTSAPTGFLPTPTPGS